MIRLFVGLVALSAAGAATAQEGNWMVPVPPRKPAVAGGQGPVIKAGTVVQLRVSDSAKNQKLGIGQRVPLVVASDVRVGSEVVIPAGATGEGEVTALNGNTIAAKALTVRVNGKLVRLSGDLAKASLGEDVQLAN